MQVKADLMMLLVTFFWGATYVLTKMALNITGPFTLMSLRFGIAFIIMAPLFYKRLRCMDKTALKYAAGLSVLLFLTFICMNFSLLYTSASNAAFLAGLGVIFIPVVSALIYRQLPSRKLMVCIALATVGICLLTMTKDLKIEMNLGDILSVLVGLIYAFFVIGTDRFARKCDPIALSTVEMGLVGLYSMAFAFSTEKITLPQEPLDWLNVLMLSVLCTALAYAVQTVAQRHTDPTHTGIILSMETVFSGVFAYFLLGEVLAPLNYLGALLLLACVFVMEVDWKGIFGKKEKVF